MNNIKNYILFFLALLLPLLSTGQKAKISFETKQHDFGIIQEKAGKVTYIFKFTNSGKAPLLIRHIEANCGCTISKWDRKPIAPGADGQIIITYNPKNRPGHFSKKITVYTNANTPNHQLKISGVVWSDPADIEKIYPFSMGALRLATDTIHLNKIEEKQVIPIFYTGKKKLSITSIIAPEYLQIDYAPLWLTHKSQGELIIRILKQRIDKYKKNDKIFLETNQGDQGNLFIIKE